MKTFAHLFIFFVLVNVLWLSGAQIAQGQTCVGTYTCCTTTTRDCYYPNGAVCTDGQPSCVCGPAYCVAGQYASGSCSDFNDPNGGGCAVINTNPAHCKMPPDTSGCFTSNPPSCPNGQYFCGAQGSCAAGCRATGGLTCTQWLNANCGGSNPPPPGCTPSCSSPYCGQSDGCGGTCSTVDRLQQPVIGAWNPVANSEKISPVYVNWNNVPRAASYEYHVQRWDGTTFVFHRQRSVAVSEAYITLAVGSYRVRARALQSTDSPLCAPSPWSEWRPFSVVPNPSCTITLTPATVSAPVGTETQMEASVTAVDGVVTQVSFVSSDPAVAAVTPGTSTASPYTTQMTLQSGGSAQISATATITATDGSTATCSVESAVSGGVLTGRVCLAPLAQNNPSYVVGTSGNTCVSVPSDQCDPVSIVDGEVLRFLAGSGVDTGREVAINPDGTFAIPVEPGVKNIQLGFTDPTNTCECPGSCTFASVTAPNPTDITFYYNPVATREPWWQVAGGSVYAGRAAGTAIFSPVPVDTCGANVTCRAVLITRNALGTEFSSGVVVTGGGLIDSRFGNTGTQDDNLDEDGRNLRSLGTLMTRYVENYTYLSRLYGLAIAQEGMRDWVGPDMSLPAGAPSGGKAAYYQPTDGSISSAWNVAADQEMIVFVNGDLEIAAEIAVEPGGFLAFVASGDITVADSVCQPDHLSDEAVMEGIFIANGAIRILGNNTGGDCKFVGEGALVGHGGVVFERDFMDGAVQSGYNSIQPVTLMKDRPDFMINLPQEMRRPMIQWQEVVQ